jgi:hypothetical protein
MVVSVQPARWSAAPPARGARTAGRTRAADTVPASRSARPSVMPGRRSWRATNLDRLGRNLHAASTGRSHLRAQPLHKRADHGVESVGVDLLEHPADGRLRGVAPVGPWMGLVTGRSPPGSIGTACRAPPGDGLSRTAIGSPTAGRPAPFAQSWIIRGIPASHSSVGGPNTRNYSIPMMSPQAT